MPSYKDKTTGIVYTEVSERSETDFNSDVWVTVKIKYPEIWEKKGFKSGETLEYPISHLESCLFTPTN